MYCSPDSSNPDPIGLSNLTSKVMCILLKQCAFISCPLASFVQCRLKGLSLLAVLQPAYQPHRGLLFSPWVQHAGNLKSSQKHIARWLWEQKPLVQIKCCFTLFQLAFFRIDLKNRYFVTYAAIAGVVCNLQLVYGI